MPSGTQILVPDSDSSPLEWTGVDINGVPDAGPHWSKIDEDVDNSVRDAIRVAKVSGLGLKDRLGFGNFQGNPNATITSITFRIAHDTVNGVGGAPSVKLTYYIGGAEQGNEAFNVGIDPSPITLTAFTGLALTVTQINTLQAELESIGTFVKLTQVDIKALEASVAFTQAEKDIPDTNRTEKTQDVDVNLEKTIP